MLNGFSEWMVSISEVIISVSNDGKEFTELKRMEHKVVKDDTYQPAVRGAEMGDGGAYVYRLGGNSCLSGDYMGLWSFDHELQIGERIIFEDMIHYTMVKTNMFNGIHHPAIAMWTKEGKAEIFRKFSYEDYRNRMS